MSEHLPRPEVVAADLAYTVATDFLLQSVFGEHTAQTGPDFRRYIELTEAPAQNDVVPHTGFIIGKSTKRPRTADRWGVPDVEVIWSAQNYTIDVPIGDTIDPVFPFPSRKLGRTGYFWQNTDGSWETDERGIGNPDTLAPLAAKQIAREKLIGTIKTVGPAAVKDYVRVVPDMEVTVQSRNQQLHTARFDADHVFAILTQHGRGEMAVARYTLGEAVDQLIQEEAVRKATS
jgi:hypothetical protein